MRGCIVSTMRKFCFRHLGDVKAIGCLFLFFVMAFSTSGHAQIPGATLREQLKSLERLHGVDVRGLDRIGEEPARVTGGDLRRQVMGLLKNYSYVVLQSDDDGVHGIRILASQGPGGPDVRGSTVPAPTRGGARPADQERGGVNGHALNATLIGFGGNEYDMSLTVDLRVEPVVLPKSMKAVLGLDGVALESAAVKTAGGEVQAETGLLPAVSVGDLVAENVEVAFVADDALKGRPLMGQSFLKHFNINYDGESAQLILMPL